MKNMLQLLVILTLFAVSLVLTNCASGSLQAKNNSRGASTAGKGHDGSGFSEDNSSFDEYDRIDDAQEKNKSLAESSRTDNQAEDSVQMNDKFYQKGIASWYGREFHGKDTASGEKFDMNKLTAAHKTLPFGTVVRIKNIQNNKIVNVRINDRGPYRGNRIIDLSYGAAKELGLLGSGQALVGLNIVGEKSKTVASEDENFGFDERNVEPVVDENISMKNYNEESSDDETFALQAGAFYSMKNAENQKMKVEELTNRPAVIIRDGDLYKVRIEGIASRNTCDKFKKILETDNITTYVLKKKIR